MRISILLLLLLSNITFANTLQINCKVVDKWHTKTVKLENGTVRKVLVKEGVCIPLDYIKQLREKDELFDFNDPTINEELNRE